MSGSQHIVPGFGGVHETSDAVTQLPGFGLHESAAAAAPSLIAVQPLPAFGQSFAAVAIEAVDGSSSLSVFGQVATLAHGTGGITTDPFKNNTGTVLANLTGLTVTVLDMATFGLVVTLTGQTTDASGVMTLSDSSIASGVEYAVVTKDATGTLGVDKYTAV